MKQAAENLKILTKESSEILESLIKKHHRNKGLLDLFTLLLTYKLSFVSIDLEEILVWLRHATNIDELYINVIYI